MRNALNKLADTVTDPAEKKVSSTSSTAYYRLLVDQALSTRLLEPIAGTPELSAH